MAEEMEILHCPRCGEVMIREPQGFWRCPRCGGEFWDDESKLAEIEEQIESAIRAEEMHVFTLWSLSKPGPRVLPLVPVWVRGKGQRKSGKKYKRRPWKPVARQRYLI